MARNTYEVRPHPTSELHRLAVVTDTKGFVYAQTWAEPWPTIEEVRAEWRDNRRGFAPYNESTGEYVG